MLLLFHKSLDPLIVLSHPTSVQITTYLTRLFYHKDFVDRPEPSHFGPDIDFDDFGSQ